MADMQTEQRGGRLREHGVHTVRNVSSACLRGEDPLPSEDGAETDEDAARCVRASFY